MELLDNTSWVSQHTDPSMAVFQLIQHMPFCALAPNDLSTFPMCSRGAKKPPLSYIAGMRMRLQPPDSPHLSQITQSLSAKHRAELEGPLLCTEQHLSPWPR